MKSMFVNNNNIISILFIVHNQHKKLLLNSYNLLTNLKNLFFHMNVCASTFMFILTCDIFFFFNCGSNRN